LTRREPTFVIFGKNAITGLHFMQLWKVTEVTFFEDTVYINLYPVFCYCSTYYCL